MPPGLDPGGFQSQGEFSDAVGLATESLGFSLGANLIQRYLNEGGSPGAEYAGTATTGGTVAYDANEHSGAQSVRIVRTSAAAVGVLGATLPWISTGIPHQNGPALQGEFWIYANSLPSSVAVPIFHASANLSQNAEIWLSPSGQVRARQQHSATGSFSAPSATSIITGQWFKIMWKLDISLPDLSTIRFCVNQDPPVTFRWANRYGTQDADQILNVSYGCMTTVQPAASNFDICFDDQVIFSIPGLRDGMLQYIGNEADAITNFEYDSTTTTGGTVALVTSQFHDGTTALRINRTSAAQANAETCGMTITGYTPHQQICGSFWIRVASYPSGVGDTPIFTAFHSVGDNLDISLSNTGQVRARRQNGNLSSGAEQSSYSASTVALNTWTQIFWSSDNSTGTMIGTVAVGSDAPQTVSWANAVEIHPWVDFGCKTFTVASNYDIYFDESYIFEGLIYPVTAQPNVVFPACTSAGTSTATATALKIQLPSRTSAGSSTTSNNALIISIAFPSSPILDSFTWANGGLSTVNPQWRRQLRSSTTNGLIVSSNQVTSSVAPADSYYAGSSFPADQEAYITIASAGTSTFGVELWVRVANPSNPGGNTLNGYFVDYDADQGPSNGALSIARSVNGSVTFLNTITLPADLTTGDKLGIRVKGSRIEVYTKLGAAPWKQVLALTDTTVTAAGYIGLWTNDSGPPLTFFDDFGGGAYNTFTLPAETGDGTSTATATGLRIRLPAVSSAGSGTTSANNVRIRLPSRTSAGTATATATALRIRLPSRTSVGTGSVAANNLRIRLPSVSSAGSATATATVLKTILQARTSAGTSTATATALRIKLPTATSAGTSTFTQGGLKIRLPSRTSAGTSSVAQSGLRDKFSPLTSAGTSTTSATGLKIRLPNRSSAGSSTSTATALKVRLANATSAGTGTATATAFRIRLPSRTSSGTSTGSTQLATRLPARTSAGSSTATQGGLKIRLPSLTSAGSSTADETALQLSGGPSNLLSVTSSGTSTATAAALRIRLPNRSSSGTASPSASGLRIQLPQRTSAGTSTATATGLKIRLPSRTSAGTGSCTANNIKIRLPSRTSAGTSTATAVGLRPKLPNRTSAGTSTATATAFRIRLPNRTSAGVGTTSTTNLQGAVSNLQNVTSNGTGSCSANNLKIKLPGRSSAGSATCTASLRIRLPSRSSAGTSTATATAFRIRLPSQTVTGSASTTRTYTQAVSADGPIGWWHLDEPSGTSAVDSISANNGTYSSVTLNQSSVVPFGGGTSVDLGQAVGKVNVVDSPFDFVGNVAYSVECWVRFAVPASPNVFDPAFRWVVGKQVPATGRSGWGLGYYFGQSVNSSGPNSGRFFFERWNNDASNGLVWTQTAPTIQPEKQYHVVATYDGANLRLWVNGVLINTSSAGLALPDTAALVAFGAFNSTFSSAFKGKIDEVAIYNYALSQVQVRAHLNAGNGYCLQIKAPNVTSAGTSSTSANNVKIRLPNVTSAGQATTTVTSLASGLVAQSHGSSTCTATAFKIRLPARTSSGTSNITQAGLRDRIALAVSAGHATCTATGFRIKLPARSTAGTSTTLGRLTTRLPARTSAGHSTATGNFLRVGFHAFSLGDSSATAQAFQIRLPGVTSSGTCELFAFSFLYIPPPPKVVVVSSTTHTVTATHTSTVVLADGTVDVVTASSTIPQVETNGGLTKTVEVGP